MAVPRREAQRSPVSVHSLGHSLTMGVDQSLYSLWFKWCLFSPLPHLLFALGQLSLEGRWGDPDSLLLMDWGLVFYWCL